MSMEKLQERKPNPYAVAVEQFMRAADKLSEHAGTHAVVVVDGMFRSDVDRVNLRNVIEALHALHALR